MQQIVEGAPANAFAKLGDAAAPEDVRRLPNVLQTNQAGWAIARARVEETTIMCIIMNAYPAIKRQCHITRYGVLVPIGSTIYPVCTMVHRYFKVAGYRGC